MYDLGNIAAVCRSAEAFGVERIYLINRHNDRFKLSRAVSVGAEKWLKLRTFQSPADCIGVYIYFRDACLNSPRYSATKS